MKSCVKLAAVALVSLTSTARAQNAISIGNVSITGGGLSFIGTVSTLSLEDKHPAFTYVGWTLIVVGTLIDNKNLVIGAASSATLPAATVWNAMLREAKVVAANPAVAADDLEIGNAARSLNIATPTLAKIVVDIDALARSQTGAEPLRAIETKYFAGAVPSPTQRQVLNNLITLASMR